MLNSQIEVINAQTADNITGIIINGEAHLYWFAVYRALGLNQEHASLVISRLTKGKHYVSFTRSEIKEIFSSNDVLSLLPVVKAYHFLTAEGMNRAIMEISTSHMNNADIAAAIDAKKDHIASIFTRYQRGETLSIADEHPALPGIVESPPVDKILGEQMGIAKVMIGIGVEPSIAHTIAFSVTESICNCGDALTPWKNLVRTDPSMIEPALLNPTDIGRSLGGMSPRTVNNLLEKFGFQVKMGSEWVPTTLGKMYSRLIPQEIKHNRGMVRKLQIKWQPSIVEKIRERLYYHDKGQTGLFTGHVVTS